MGQFGQIAHTHTYDVPFHTRKVFTTLRVNSPSFSGRTVPLFDTMLVHQDATIKGRSLETGEEEGVKRSTKRGSNDTEELVNVHTSLDTANILNSRVQVVSVPPAVEVSTIGIPTGSGMVPTASPIFTTASVVTPYSRRQAREMEEQMAREDQRRSEQIAREAEIARIHAEEELQMMIDGLGRSNEMIAKHLHEYEQAAAELTIGEKIELINELVKYQDHHSKILNPKKMKTLEEVSQEDLKERTQLVPVEERVYWKIIRLGGSTTVYHLFVDMLKHFDREDLIQLWTLVKETLSIRQATSYKEKELWVELKRDQEIFMLVEKDYSLRNGLAIVMISNKLRVKNYSQMDNDLIMKIHNIANSPRQRDD
nr:hypothetical protein [Tanacetum cinerariifolium]